MAAVSLTTEQKIYMRVPKLSRWCRGKLAECGYKKTDLAKYLGTTDQNIYKIFKNDSITVPILIAICNMCDVEPEELERILKV